MSVSDRELLHHLSRMPFLNTAELAMITGEAHVAVHRGLASLLSGGTVGRVSHGTAHLPSSGRYYLTAKGITEAAGMLGFDTASDYVRAYPVSREWLTLLNRRMDAVATIYLLVASPSPGADGLRTQVDFHPRGRFHATITRHDGLSFGLVRQGLALRRRSLYDRLRGIAAYGYRRRHQTGLELTSSVVALVPLASYLRNRPPKNWARATSLIHYSSLLILTHYRVVGAVDRVGTDVLPLGGEGAHKGRPYGQQVPWWRVGGQLFRAFPQGWGGRPPGTPVRETDAVPVGT